MPEKIKNYIFPALGVLCLIIVGIMYVVSRQPQQPIPNPVYQTQVYIADGAEEVKPEVPVYIIVHVVGEVNRPGVVSIPAGSRALAAIEAAGGETEYADLLRINLATVLSDAMQIIVPRIGQASGDVFIGGSATQEASGLININTASSAELQTLTGIGPVIAQNIINFRETHGPFASVDELINVPRIGAATLENLRPFVTV